MQIPTIIIENPSNNQCPDRQNQSQQHPARTSNMVDCSVQVSMPPRVFTSRGVQTSFAESQLWEEETFSIEESRQELPPSDDADLEDLSLEPF